MPLNVQKVLAAAEHLQRCQAEMAIEQRNCNAAAATLAGSEKRFDEAVARVQAARDLLERSV